MSSTPSKPRRAARPVQGDDHTDVTSPPAPWDGRDEGEEPSQDPDGTKQTGVAIRSAAPVPTPTNKHSSAPDVDDYDLAPGTALGEYRIEAKIGQGGMGVVYSAVHPLIGKRAAIKILNKELCADPHQLERFVDEARVVNQIGHANIVDVFAFGEMPDGRRFFVMEWLKGETLRARIARGKLGAGEVSAIVRPLARALEAAHEKGVIHRDLKPDNVFLVDVRGEQPTVKLLDFGIAKLASNEHRVEKTATGAIVGTPQYIAPEQAKGYAIDHRADIYALGGIIYELLTGRPPFVADNAMEMVAKHLMETPLPPSQFVPGVPPELDDLVLRMLAKTPQGRPPLTEICDVVERMKVRASTQPAFGMDGIPLTLVPRADSTPVPRGLDDAGTAQSQPVGVAPSGARSQPVYDAVVSQAQPVAGAPRRTPLWIAILGVPLAGLAAFLIVSATGGSSKDPEPAVSGSAPVVAPVVAPRIDPITEPSPASPSITKPAVVAPETIKPTVRVPPPVTAPAVTRPAARSQVHLIIGGARDHAIFIDGKKSIADPKLVPGVYEVEIRAPGMQTQKLQLTVAATPVTKHIQLTALPRVKADPPKVKANPPKVTSDPPKVKADPPKMKADLPKVKADPPKVKVDPPKVKADPPKADPPRVDLPKPDGTELMAPGSIAPGSTRR